MLAQGVIDVQSVLTGKEPSIAEKWEAKAAAWSNGMRPKQTSHSIYLGDARLMPEGVAKDVHLVVTSPPYFNLIQYESASNKRQLGNAHDYSAFLDELDIVWRHCFRRLVPGSRMCVVVGDVCVSRREAKRHYVFPLHADISVRCREIGFDFLTPILWSKIANATTEVAGANRFLGKPYEPNGIIKNDIEYILMFRKPGRYRRPTVAQRALSVLEPEEHDAGYRSIWSDIRGETRKAGHPAPFPRELAERLIRLFSFVGDTVLDPFWGSGTTTIAAANSARSSIGYEIEKKYLGIGKKRLSKNITPIVPADFRFYL